MSIAIEKVSGWRCDSCGGHENDCRVTVRRSDKPELKRVIFLCDDCRKALREQLREVEDAD